MPSAILRSRLRRYEKSNDSLDGSIKIYYNASNFLLID